MAQTGFQLMDEAKSISVLNESGTTVIYAGDLVHSAANDDKFTGTAARARAGYAAGDVKVRTNTASSTGYKTPIGVAITDIAADGYGMVALEGMFIHPADGNTEAGDPIMGVASSNSVVQITAAVAGSTTANATSIDLHRYRVGRALTGGSAAGKYLLWKLTV